MSNEFEDKSRFINLIKKINGGFFALNIKNGLMGGFRSPKLIVTAVQPAPEGDNAKCIAAKYYLGVSDALAVADTILRTKVGENEQKLFVGYQGGPNNKEDKQCIEARVMTLSAKVVTGKNGAVPYYKFTVENCEGVQNTIKNGLGEDVPGVVKPKSGGKVFAKCSFSASKSEALYIANMIRMELQAWRTAVNVDMYYHPDKFRYNGGNSRGNVPAANARRNNQQPPTA